MSLWHIDYEIDKEYWRNIFYENLDYGKWHYTCASRKSLYWFHLMMFNDDKLKKIVKPLEQDLNIYGLNNAPRFSYLFPNQKVEHHLDDQVKKEFGVKININLLDTEITIHMEHKPYQYEAALIDVGHVMHGVEKDPNARLTIGFFLRHPLEEVYERLDKFSLIKNG